MILAINIYALIIQVLRRHLGVKRKMLRLNSLLRWMEVSRGYPFHYKTQTDSLFTRR
jgi:hypothetical protein